MIATESINRFPLITGIEEDANITLFAHYTLKAVNDCIHPHISENIILGIYIPFYITFENDKTEIYIFDITNLRIRGPPATTRPNNDEGVL